MRPNGVHATRLLALGLCLASSGAAAAPLGRVGEIPRLRVKGGGLELPLQHTAVRAEVAGLVARVEVTQTYRNPFEQPIEAVYVFPLPDAAAVDDFRLVVGARVIEGEVRAREEARRVYEEAKRSGHTAALLEQERPNVFTQSIANLAPREPIRVVIRYVQDLAYDEGRYEFSFPMVVGPRYLPGEPLEGRTGLGASPDTTRVPDASRISPFVVPEGLRSGHDVSLEVAVESALPLRGHEVPTHEVEASQPDTSHLLVRLAAHDSVPNRDFVLRWEVAGKEPQARVMTYKPDRPGGYFTLVVQPPALDVEQLVGQRELIFVVDVSGSMSGLPLWLCQQAMRDALRRLRPGDTFNVISFSGATAQAFPSPRRASQENVTDALGFVQGMRAGGGTELLDAVGAALRPEVEAGRRRYVFFLTDGFVGNDEGIIGATRGYVSALERRGQRGRVFSFGVGSSPNRYLLDGIAQAGKGLAFYASNREDPVRAVVQFFRKIDHPVLEDVSIDWGTLPVSHLLPASVPDLFLSRPLVVHGRYEVAAQGRVVVRGYADGRKVELPVEVRLDAEPHGNPALASLWARARVADELDGLAYGRFTGANVNEAAVKETVTGLGITYRLMTPYTSFVAVDRSRVVGDGAPATVLQPVEVPEDVDAASAGAMGLGAANSGLLRALGGYGSGPVGNAMGYGGLGLSGVGTGGGGSGGMALFRGRGVKGSLGQSGELSNKSEVKVTGAMDREVVRRVIQAHASQVRFCYEQALLRNPALAGRMVVRFEIAPDGSVKSVQVTGGTLRDAQLEAALLSRIRTWRFPSPAGGASVWVTYPFVFKAT